jgi:hypothetical protein
MRILVWNFRGLGNTAAVLALLDVKRRHCPVVVFLSESHLDRYRMECLGRILLMDSSTIQPSDGRKGGIIMFWRKEVNLYQSFACPIYIDVRIDEGLNKVWRLTGMYGESKWRINTRPEIDCAEFINKILFRE